MSPLLPATADTVCSPCRKRKKACSKTLPSCSRCTRFQVQCTYPAPAGVSQGGFVAGGLARGAGGTGYSPRIEEQILSQARRVVDGIARGREGGIEGFVEVYFRTFHRSMPVLDREGFYAQLRTTSWHPALSLGRSESESGHFLALVGSVVLISHLSAEISGEGGGDAGGGCAVLELYEMVKSLFSMEMGRRSLDVDLVRVGILLAAWEYCQGLGRESWVSVGACARMGYVLGLHRSVGEGGGESEGRREVEMKRCVWWGVVVLERIINMEYEHDKLPFASKAPALDDILPIIPGDREASYPVSTDLVTPDMTVYEGAELFNREFTRLGNFGSTIQATYLSSLVSYHIAADCQDSRRADARNLDIALQSFACTLIPPPGMADGQYCGAFGLRTLSLFTLHIHSHAIATQTSDTEGVARATIALQSLSRILIHMTKSGQVGKPLDYDAMAFWAHTQCAQAALVHIRFGERGGEWESDLEVLKGYLRGFAGRFGLHDRYMRDIEEAERISKEEWSPQTVSEGTAMEC